ncbi:GtrA family protein [Candidatus Woesearchaeota archaeon]|jgi:putative flippase GtrA|nr:GtrA family protein [Candidatus Woesearchaeota archaeon]
MVGVINTLVYYIIYSGFLYVEIGYKLSALFATIFGVFFSFKTFGKFVFLNSDNSLVYKFFLTYSFVYVINIALINYFNTLLHNYYVSGFISSIFCALVSFFLNKNFVFQMKSLNSNKE